MFSGAGGLDLGLVQAGNEVVWANDIDKDAVETYRSNISQDILLGDISTIDFDSIPDGDVVVGGFPCQGFSLANMRRSVDDERNLLYKYCLKMLVAKRPRYFIAENVRGILNIGGGTVLEQILSDFQDAGYFVSVNKINMADYGVPQKRIRVVFLGTRKDLGSESVLSIPAKTHSDDPKDKLPGWISIQQALEHFPEPSESGDIPNHVASSYKLSFRNFTGHRPTDPAKPSPTILARGNGKGGVVAIPHYNGKRRLTVRESACVQTFPDDFVFSGKLNSCYRQIGNAVPVAFGRLLGDELIKIEDRK